MVFYKQMDNRNKLCCVMVYVTLFFWALPLDIAQSVDVLRDDFFDHDYTNNPTWVVVSGTFDASSGSLAFGTDAATTITLDFPAINTAMSVSYRLHQSNGTAGNFGFETYLVDTASGLSHAEWASTNLAGYGGPSGFHSWDSGGNVTNSLPAANDRSLAEAFPGYVTMQFDFDPVSGVKFYFEGALMAQWPNFNGMTQVNQVKLITSGPGVSWFIDDVVLSPPISGPRHCGDKGTAYPLGDVSGAEHVPDCKVDWYDMVFLAANWLRCSDPLDPDCEFLHHATGRNENAIGMMYQGGVPHTNATGTSRTTYTPGTSFFPIIMWGARPSSGLDDWSNLVGAGYNTVAPWFLDLPSSYLSQGAVAGLQVIVKDTTGTFLGNGTVGGHANLLAIAWAFEDPTNFFFTGQIASKYSDYLAFRSVASSIAPGTPVIVSDLPLIAPPTDSWWVTWNTTGEVSSHKNLPVGTITASLGQDPAGIPQSTTAAVEANSANKPFWLVVGACESVGASVDEPGYRFPTEMQLRAEVYAGIARGATGIGYMTWDSSETRNNDLIGMAPNPPASYVQGQTEATPEQLVQSQTLWLAAQQINSELVTLTPAILSPTSTVDYSVVIEWDSRTHTPIYTLLKPDPLGGFTLITINVDNAIFRVTYTWPFALTAVQPMFENRSTFTLDPGATSFIDTYEPYQVHVYHID
jgi:hypothetical protein